MKNTQKKLKAKHFRYLSKEYVKDPDRFLKEVVHQWGLNWSNNFNYLINSSLYPPMRNSFDYSYGFIFTHMRQMVEIAFVISTKCNISPVPKEHLFQRLGKEIFQAEIEDEIILPTNLLSDICGYKTLKEWYDAIDGLLLAKDMTNTDDTSSCFNLEYIAIRELLVRLPQVLLHVYEKGGIKYYLTN